MPSDAKLYRKMCVLHDENRQLKETMKNVLTMLNTAWDKASIQEVSNSGWISAAVTNSIQELDACLNGEGAKEKKR